MRSTTTRLVPVPLELDRDCQSALDLAKRCVADGEPLDAATLLAALVHSEPLRAGVPSLAKAVPPPRARRAEPPGRVALAEDLRPLFQRLADSGRVVSMEMLLAGLLRSEPGRAALRSLRVPEDAVPQDLGSGGPERSSPAPDFGKDSGGSAWRASPGRSAALRSLGSYGRILTDGGLPRTSVVEREDVMRALVRTLSKMKRRNAIVVGPAGTGKSALIYELARRIHAGDSRLPARLRDTDIFELSPSFLRSGASMVGEYDERVKGLLKVLEAHRNIILFVDEIHSLFQSGVHERGPFTDANESFKAALGRGSIMCLGCTTPAEFRRYIEPDPALERRFGIIRLEAPSREATLQILTARRSRLEEFYAPLSVPDEALERAVALTDEYLPGRFQPDKAIQLLDEACAFCVTEPSAPERVTEAALVQALGDMVGHGIRHRGSLTIEEVLDRLREKIVGQDAVLAEIARAFVSGFGDWTRRSGPRGVFLFGGPTGTGKTETAVALARILGSGDRDLLVRVDCNTLQGSARDAGPAIGRLLGVPPGYVGYARGQGGILSRIRDLPECVVLFDEFEKAAAGVGRLLLQIIDEGKVEDVDGNRLDFRRAFVVFTTNAGCHGERRRLGFAGNDSGEAAAEHHLQGIRRELRDVGLGDEFLARVTHTMIFGALDEASIRVVLQQRLEALRRTSELKGLDLEWSSAVVEHLARQWHPRYGVRFAAAVLRNRVGEQLDVAEAQGELKGVKSIRVEVLEAPAGASPDETVGLASRRRDGQCMIVSLR